MPDLSAYLNVYNTSLVIINAKGYSIRTGKHEKWYANKEGWEFMADNPIELLGLIAIYEFHRPQFKSEYWWKIDVPDILGRLDSSH